MTGRGRRIGYVPYTPALEMPGDRRRFVYYAKARGIEFELADPDKYYDVVILSERADISVWSRYDKGAIVYDLIDSYLAVPRTSLKGQLRGLAKYAFRQSRYFQPDYRKAVEDMCRRANAVICTTDEQKLDIQRYCSNVHIILDGHGAISSIGMKNDYSASEPFRLVWEGMPQTVGGVLVLRSILERINQRCPIEVHVVTDVKFARFLGRYGWTRTEDLLRKFGVPTVFHEWREDALVRTIAECDLAIIPLDLEDPFAAGKPENKLLLLWRLAMPVLTSSTPAYCRAMAGAGLAMTCRTLSEWENAILQFAGNESARQAAGAAGRRYAEVAHSEPQLLAQWDAVFQSLAQTN